MGTPHLSPVRCIGTLATALMKWNPRESRSISLVNHTTAPAVLIVGAGPTGLVLALWLTRLAITVRIIDKLAEAGTTSRALAVQARTLEFYRQLGMADALVEN